MLIDCPSCRARVVATVDGSTLIDQDPDTLRIAVGKCPACLGALVGLQEQTNHFAEDELPAWTAAERLWPDPERVVDMSVPRSVGHPLREANRCLSAGAFNACAVMCGRAIEALCADQTQERTTFFQALQRLRDLGVIDGRLFDWGNALRQLRNVGAHATEEPMLAEDAADALDFAHAIVQYVYTLSVRFNNFMARRKAPGS